MPILTVAPARRGWMVHRGCPATWQHSLERCGGAYFHSRAATCGHVGAGETLYFEWRQGEEVIGVATGVQRRCRLDDSPRHVYLPTLPAVLHPSERGEAIDALITMLADEGVAEFTCDSLNARGVPATARPPEQLRRRVEYVIPLDASPAAIVARWSDAHRAQLQATARSNWSLTTPTGEAACDAVAAVARDAGPGRIAPPDNTFGGDHAMDLLLGSGPLVGPWGRTTFVASDDRGPLAYAIVGWANRRAFHLMGAATRAGRQRPATTWLHARIISELCARGFTSYCLGGARAEAIDPSDDLHGLHCYRVGMAATPVICAGARWVLDAAHEAAHRCPAHFLSVCPS